MEIKPGGGGGGDWQNPSEGFHNAVCVDVEDLGVLTTKYGDKHKILIRFQTEETIKEGEYKGEPVLAFLRATLSVNEKSNLAKHLVSWGLTTQAKLDKEGFNTDDMLGQHCRLLITHSESEDGKVYANITKIDNKQKKDIEPTWRRPEKADDGDEIPI